MSQYFDLFESWADVQSYFKMSEEEPEVLFAAYEYENYSGEAYVIFKRGGKYWSVEGGHCSCHGLENQWELEEFIAPALRIVLDNITEDWDRYSLKARHKEALLKVCELVEAGW